LLNDLIDTTMFYSDQITGVYIDLNFGITSVWTGECTILTVFCQNLSLLWLQ